MRRIPDDFVELHASRLLLLILGASEKTRKGVHSINSRVKIAKLDFFLRYPSYLEKALKILISEGKLKGDTKVSADSLHSIDPSMIRYHYGPWDKKYYNILNFLVAYNLISVKKNERGVDTFSLTKEGEEKAKILCTRENYKEIKDLSAIIGTIFGDWKGTTIKNFIYQHFPELINLPLGTKIKP